MDAMTNRSGARGKLSLAQTACIAVMTVLGVLALLLAWMGARSIAHGLGFMEASRDDASIQGVFLLLGALQIGGAGLGLFGLYRFARTWRLLPQRKPATTTSIRERALENLKAARSPRT